MNGIEKNHSRVVAVFLDELESLMVIGSIGVVCQVLDFIQVFFVERIGKRLSLIHISGQPGRNPRGAAPRAGLPSVPPWRSGEFDRGGCGRSRACGLPG